MALYLIVMPSIEEDSHDQESWVLVGSATVELYVLFLQVFYYLGSPSRYILSGFSWAENSVKIMKK